MNLSNNYLFYADNQELDKVIDNYRQDLPEIEEKPRGSEVRSYTLGSLNNTYGSLDNPRYADDFLQGVYQTIDRAQSQLDQKSALNDWCEGQNNLAMVLAALGQRQQDTELLARAAEACHDALEVINEEQEPQLWAKLHSTLGSTLLSQGQHKGGAKLLKASVAAYTSAVRVWTRESDPHLWSATMHNLGGSLHAHGLLLSGNKTLQKSVVAYKNAITQRDTEYFPVERAITHNNQAVALHNLAEREDNPDRMQEAIRAYKKCLSVWDEQLLPIHMAAMTMVNLGTARRALAELTQSVDDAECAADDLVLVIELFPHACHPHCLQRCKDELKISQGLVDKFKAA